MKINITREDREDRDQILSSAASSVRRDLVRPPRPTELRQNGRTDAELTIWSRGVQNLIAGTRFTRTYVFRIVSAVMCASVVETA